MKKIIKKCCVVAMSFVVAVSAMAGCKNNNGDSDSGSKQEDAIGTITPSTSLYDMELDTLHIINVTLGTKDFIVNGQTEYQIVIPTVLPNDETGLAAEELKYFLDEATGADIQIVTDAGLSYDSSKKYISVGDTSLVNSAGISVDKSVLTRSGFRIISKGNSVFLIGGGDYGTLYSAYEFLTQEIGFEVYSGDTIYYKKTNSLKLHEFDVTDVPDIEYVLTPLGTQYFNASIRQRMRFNHEREVWMGPKGMSWHNTLAYLPPEEWKAAHSDWYSKDGVDLCFYANGNATEYEAFFEAFMNSFISVLEANPDIDNITITQQDMNTWCDCALCKADLAKYGTNAATIVKFCNKVSDALKVYFEENDIDRKVNICFFAYQKTTAAPVTKNAEGKYVPIDNDVICRDNVYCFYAPISAEFLYGFDKPENSYYLETMDKWCAITSHMYLWIYAVNFYDSFKPYNAIVSMQDTYIVAKAHNVSYLYDQCWWNQENAGDWMNLRAYLTSKLRWNVKANVQELVESFMDNHYQAAAESMKKAFALYNTWFEHLKSDVGVGGSYMDSKLYDAANFPKGFVDGMLKCFDEAYAAIEPLKGSDPILYEKLQKRICLETFPYRYLNIEYYGTYYTDAELLALKLSFKEDARFVGLTHSTESKSIDELFEQWGVA